mgnify:CR=1 FL=1|jgi:hypothetical protein
MTSQSASYRIQDVISKAWSDTLINSCVAVTYNTLVEDCLSHYRLPERPNAESKFDKSWTSDDMFKPSPLAKSILAAGVLAGEMGVQSTCHCDIS